MFQKMQPRYIARLARGYADIRRAQGLRHEVFYQQAGGRERPGKLDCDRFDDRFQHVLLEEFGSGRLAGCFRFLPLSCGAEIDAGYSAQFYDLSGLRGYRRPMVEVGRLCAAPWVRDPDVMRVTLAALTRIADATGAGLLFGCSSFSGNVVGRYAATLALLQEGHLGPARWRPGVRAARTFPLAAAKPAAGRAEERDARLDMPPLLRSYLALGGWVSDHAVIDEALGTLHVFTGLEVARIPPRRVQALRALAARDIGPLPMELGRATQGIDALVQGG